MKWVLLKEQIMFLRLIHGLCCCVTVSVRAVYRLCSLKIEHTWAHNWRKPLLGVHLHSAGFVLTLFSTFPDSQWAVYAIKPKILDPSRSDPGPFHQPSTKLVIPQNPWTEGAVKWWSAQVCKADVRMKEIQFSTCTRDLWETLMWM